MQSATGPGHSRAWCRGRGGILGLRWGMRAKGQHRDLTQEQALCQVLLGSCPTAWMHLL